MDKPTLLRNEGSLPFPLPPFFVTSRLFASFSFSHADRRALLIGRNISDLTVSVSQKTFTSEKNKGQLDSNKDYTLF